MMEKICKEFSRDVAQDGDPNLYKEAQAAKKKIWEA